MEKKICAFFRQTWYENAKENMPDEDRLLLYELLFEYEFYGREPVPTMPLSVKLMFGMIRPDIDRDLERMKTRAEVARQNGSLGGRPRKDAMLQQTEKPNGFSENPIGSAGLHNYNIQLQNTTKDSNVCPLNAHTEFFILFNFFEEGVTDPGSEFDLFCAYYQARGWEVAPGKPVKDVVALAKSWRPKDCTAALMKTRAEYCRLIITLGICDARLINQFIGIRRNDQAKTITIELRSKDVVDLIESKADLLPGWIQEGYTLNYSVIQ